MLTSTPAASRARLKRRQAGRVRRRLIHLFSPATRRRATTRRHTHTLCATKERSHVLVGRLDRADPSLWCRAHPGRSQFRPEPRRAHNLRTNAGDTIKTRYTNAGDTIKTRCRCVMVCCKKRHRHNCLTALAVLSVCCECPTIVFSGSNRAAAVHQPWSSCASSRAAAAARAAVHSSRSSLHTAVNTCAAAAEPGHVGWRADGIRVREARIAA